MTMTFTSADLATFFLAEGRSKSSAEVALKDLESREITGNPYKRRLASPRALCDSTAQKAGFTLAQLSSHELGRLLSGRSVEALMNPDTGSVDTADGWHPHDTSALVPVRWTGSQWVEA